MKPRVLAAYGFLVVAAVFLDQWIKYLVESRLVLHEQVDLLPFLALYRTYNEGIAFSMFSSLGATGLIVMVVAVVAFILFLFARSGPQQYFARVGFALVIGGAIGNLIDRLVLGHVVDYVLFHTPAWSFAIFNLADAFITVGAIMVVLEEIRDWWRERSSSKV